MEYDITDNSCETRQFIHSLLTSVRGLRISCVLCNYHLEIRNKYPHVSGVLFISPVQHTNLSALINFHDTVKYLSAVCLDCNYGKLPSMCIYCSQIWTGFQFRIGILYTFDVFAAIPCCEDRLKCFNCSQPQRPVPIKYSDFSREFKCNYCSRVDAHYVKKINQIFKPAIEPFEHQ